MTPEPSPGHERHAPRGRIVLHFPDGWHVVRWDARVEARRVMVLDPLRDAMPRGLEGIQCCAKADP